MASAEEFFAIDMRVGTVLQAEPFPEARKPSIKLLIDFGADIGHRRSSAQLTVHYTPEQLVGRQIVAAVNLGPRRIAGFTSEVLVLGAMASPTEVVLLSLERPVANGTRIG
jgi:tRNA-binding protein